MTNKFTGYYDLSGKHIEDGLKNRPLAFEDLGDSVVLRWIHPSGGKAYEFEIKMSKEHARASWDSYPFTQMNMGISAIEGLSNWLKQNP